MRKQIFSIAALTVACLVALPAIAASSLTPISDSYAYSISGDDHPTSYLGVDTQDLTPERVSALHLKDEQGVEVTMVDQDAPAGKAGIKEHDVITRVNGENVESVEQLRRLIREIPSGRTVTISLIRNGQPLTLKADLASRDEAFDFHIPPQVMNFTVHDMPNMANWDIPVSVVVVHSALRSGLMLENLNQQLSEYFGVKNGRGILVRSVEKGTLAEKSGFRAGDVIVRVNETPISDSSDFSRALRSGKGKPVNVAIIRDKKEQHLILNLPEHSQSNFPLPQSSENNMELQINSEMAKLRPQIEMAVQQARETANQVRQSFDNEELKKQMEEFREQEQKQQQQLKMEMRKLHQKLSMEMNAI